MFSLLQKFMSKNGLGTFHLLIVAPILGFLIVPAICTLIMISTPVIGFISVYSKEFLKNIYNILKEKINQITNYEQLQLKWGFAQLNKTGRIIEGVTQSKLTLYQQQLYYKLYSDFVHPDSDIYILDNTEAEEIKNYYRMKLGKFVVSCKKDENPPIRATCKRITVIYSFNATTDRFRHFTNLSLYFSREAKKRELEVELVSSGSVDMKSIAYFHANLPSHLELIEKKDWSINVSHAVNLELAQKKDFIANKTDLNTTYKLLLRRIIHYYDNKLVDSFKNMKTKYMVFKYKLIL